MAFKRVYPHQHPDSLCEGRVTPPDYLPVSVGNSLCGFFGGLSKVRIKHLLYSTQGSFTLQRGESANSRNPIVFVAGCRYTMRTTREGRSVCNTGRPFAFGTKKGAVKAPSPDY